MLTPADPMEFGAGWHFYPQHPLGPQFSKAPGCRQGGSGTVVVEELGTDQGEWAQNGAAEAMARQAVPLWGIWGEAGCHGSPEPTLGSNGSFHPKASPFPK